MDSRSVSVLFLAPHGSSGKIVTECACDACLRILYLFDLSVVSVGIDYLLCIVIVKLYFRQTVEIIIIIGDRTAVSVCLAFKDMAAVFAICLRYDRLVPDRYVCVRSQRVIGKVIYHIRGVPGRVVLYLQELIVFIDIFILIDMVRIRIR